MLVVAWTHPVVHAHQLCDCPNEMPDDVYVSVVQLSALFSQCVVSQYVMWQELVSAAYPAFRMSVACDAPDQLCDVPTPTTPDRKPPWPMRAPAPPARPCMTSSQSRYRRPNEPNTPPRHTRVNGWRSYHARSHSANTVGRCRDPWTCFYVHV